MIEKVTMYQAVCDRCGRNSFTEGMDVWSYDGSALRDALESGWAEIGGKLYCPNCYMVNDNDEYEVAIM